MRSLAPRVLAACVASIVALSCTDVPTFADDIAYISPILFPSSAIAAGDTLRDSLGRVMPIRVLAFSPRDDTLPATATYLVTSPLPPLVTISPTGIVVAADTIRSVDIVGRVGDRLQTTSGRLEIVAQPDSIARTGTLDSLVALQASSPLQVNVSALRRGTRVPVPGIAVRYQITAVVPARTIDQKEFFFQIGLRGDLTRSVDTTDASGNASRAIIATAPQGTESVEVLASAKSLRGIELPGSPVRFVLRVKKGA